MQRERRDTVSGVYLPYYYYKSLLLIKLRVLVRLPSPHDARE